MKKIKIYWRIMYFVTVGVLIYPSISISCYFKVLSSGFSISTTQRHEWHPWVEYNSVDDEFLVFWNTSGKLRDDCAAGDDYECINSFQSVHAQRYSSKGEPLDDAITVSPAEGPNDSVSWKSMPRLVYNELRNEYMMVFMVGQHPTKPTQDNVIFTARLSGEGTILSPPAMLHPTLYNASHPDVAFNSQNREYLIIYNDKYQFRDVDDFDNIGFIVNEDGEIQKGPFNIGLPFGSKFAPYVEYNSKDNTYLFAWEDWRYGDVPWYLRPDEIYGSMLDDEGNMLANIPVVDDFGLADEGETQLMPSIAYNPHRNEFLVVWNDSRPSLDDGGIMGRIIKSDGTPKGADFVVIDGPGTQGAPKVIYVKERRKYFVVWQDSRDYTPPPDAPEYERINDIYAQWLKPNGKALGDDILIYKAEGNQSMPSVAYSPKADSFFITWRDENAEGDFTPVGPGAVMAPEIKADVRGAIYGRTRLFQIK